MHEFWVASWNACKKSSGAAPKVCRALRRQFGEFVGILQEVPAWSTIDGLGYSGHQVLAPPDCDCGFLIPRHWMSAVGVSGNGRYWAGVVVGPVILLSAHILDRCVDDGRAETVFRETCAFVARVRATNRHVAYQVVLGVDGNVTLQPDTAGVSGIAVLPRKAGHTPSMQRVVAR